MNKPSLVSTFIMPSEAVDPHWPELVRSRRAVMVADLVESVRLVRDYEDEVIDRWRRLISEIRSEVLPPQQGRMVKSLGDGMLLEFGSVVNAVRAAFDINRRIQAHNAGRPVEKMLHMRYGIDEAEIVIDDLDVYGAGVNLASRLASLAGPDEIVISPAARGSLVQDLDVDIEDLGECYLKHFALPQRAYRCGPLGKRSIMWPTTSAGVSDRVSVAVIPFPVSGSDASNFFGEVLADDLIAQLSQLHQLHVVSRLSTTVFREREPALDTVAAALGCQYVVHGSCVVRSDKVRLRAQVIDCQDSSVLWAGALDGSVSGVLEGDSPLVTGLAETICHSLVGAEVRRAATLPLPSLRSYTILLGAVAMMHRLSRQDFDRSRDMLLYLVERHPRAVAPRSWLGKWHVMQVAQGWSADPLHDANEARRVVSHALDVEPAHALALAIDGLICAYLNKDLALAGERYEAALRSNPSESLAWLFQSSLHSYAGEGERAVECATRAQRLSPLDPMKYYYDNFTSMAMLAAGNHDAAIEIGKRSLKANRTHGSTLRILAIAQVFAGRVDEARATMSDMLKVESGFSVSRFLDRYPGAAAPHAAKWAEALRLAGLPN